MCSQFENKASISQIVGATKSTVDDQITDLEWEPHVYPHTKAPVVTRHEYYNSIRLMNYSLVPFWSKTNRPKFSTYNARLDRVVDGNRLERIYTTPTWKTPFSSQRCLVPLTGFYESCTTGTHAGHIVKFHSTKSDDLFLAAGVWDKWTDHQTGEIVFSFAIITDNPCDYIQEIGHDRQPVFLKPEDANLWLDSQLLKSEQAYTFLKSRQEPIKYAATSHKLLRRFQQYDLFS